jgi:hypothetical protein
VFPSFSLPRFPFRCYLELRIPKVSRFKTSPATDLSIIYTLRDDERSASRKKSKRERGRVQRNSDGDVERGGGEEGTKGRKGERASVSSLRLLQNARETGALPLSPSLSLSLAPSANHPSAQTPASLRPPCPHSARK